jgi:hypothetical protein
MEDLTQQCPVGRRYTCKWNHRFESALLQRRVRKLSVPAQSRLNPTPRFRRQSDQARTDFALIESNLEFISGQLARVPTRAFLCRTVLLATASV